MIYLNYFHCKDFSLPQKVNRRNFCSSFHQIFLEIFDQFRILDEKSSDLNFGLIADCGNLRIEIVQNFLMARRFFRVESGECPASAKKFIFFLEYHQAKFCLLEYHQDL